MSITAPTTTGPVRVAAGAPHRRPRRRRWRSIAILLAALVGAGTVTAISAVLVVSARDVWFENLDRPTWGLSSQAITAAGVGLALTRGLAGWRIWVRAPGSTALTLWVVQLGIGLSWTVLFFGLWLPRWALAAAILLAVITLATIVAAWRPTRSGAVLLLPPLGWAGYLVALNAAVIALN